MSHLRRARRCCGPLFGLALLLTVGGWGPSDPAPSSDPFAQPPAKDPDDAPFIKPPRNQLDQWSAGRERPLTRGFDDDHRLQLTALPTYAALHVPFIGRGNQPLRGGGIALEFDLRLQRWLFLRAYASHTIHPAFEETFFDEDEDEILLLANSGLVQASNAGVSIVYALDIGRVVPRLDIGAGLMSVRSPDAAQAGQWGGECREGGVCDLGLSCNTEDICRPAAFVEAHAGLGIDVLFGQRWAVGVGVRYYALLSSLSQLPVYLHGSLRLAARF